MRGCRNMANAWALEFGILVSRVGAFSNVFTGPFRYSGTTFTHQVHDLRPFLIEQKHAMPSNVRSCSSFGLIRLSSLSPPLKSSFEPSL